MAPHVRIVSQASSWRELVGLFAPFLDGRTLFVPTPAPPGEGAVAVTLTLADGEPVLRGAATVVEAYGDRRNFYGRVGMKLRLDRLDARGEETLTALAGPIDPRRTRPNAERLTCRVERDDDDEAVAGRPGLATIDDPTDVGRAAPAAPWAGAGRSILGEGRARPGPTPVRAIEAFGPPVVTVVEPMPVRAAASAPLRPLRRPPRADPGQVEVHESPWSEPAPTAAPIVEVRTLRLEPEPDEPTAPSATPPSAPAGPSAAQQHAGVFGVIDADARRPPSRVPLPIHDDRSDRTRLPAMPRPAPRATPPFARDEATQIVRPAPRRAAPRPILLVALLAALLGLATGYLLWGLPR